MTNQFNYNYDFYKRYDLKGSEFSRSSKKNGMYPKDSSIARKCNDWRDENECLYFGTSKDQQDIKEKLIFQIERDVKFFQQNNIIDYSLLVGFVQFDSDQLQAKKDNNEDSLDKIDANQRIQTKDICDQNGQIIQPILKESQYINDDMNDNFEKSPTNFINRLKQQQQNNKKKTEDEKLQEARFYEKEFGGMMITNSRGQKEIVFIGIIDTLIEYNAFKKMENMFKTNFNKITFKKGEVSCVHPQWYGERFKKFIVESIKTIPQEYQ